MILNVFFTTIFFLIITIGFSRVVFGNILKFENFNISEEIFFGLLLLGFLNLVINFFYPINIISISLIFSIGLISFFLSLKTKKINKFTILKLSLISFLTTILLFASNSFDDFQLYHLPYITLLSDNKIIFGSNLLNERFGQTSLLQYLEVSLFYLPSRMNYIQIPSAIFFSNFFIFFSWLTEFRI